MVIRYVLTVYHISSSPYRPVLSGIFYISFGFLDWNQFLFNFLYLRFITVKFLDVINTHAPLKRKTLSGNQAPFMTKELSKEIYTRSKLNNKCKRKTTDKCVSLGE